MTFPQDEPGWDKKMYNGNRQRIQSWIKLLQFSIYKIIIQEDFYMFAKWNNFSNSSM
jgi:hypothetical protein